MIAMCFQQGGTEGGRERNIYYCQLNTVYIIHPCHCRFIVYFIAVFVVTLYWPKVIMTRSPSGEHNKKLGAFCLQISLKKLNGLLWEPFRILTCFEEYARISKCVLLFSYHDTSTQLFHTGEKRFVMFQTFCWKENYLLLMEYKYRFWVSDSISMRAGSALWLPSKG